MQVINQAFLAAHAPDQITVEVIKVDEKHELNSDDSEAEIDEMWRYVGCKSNKRWLWHAIDRETRKVLAYVFGERQDRVFLELKRLLEPFGINRFYPDDWEAYERNLDPEQHIIGKRNTQKIERAGRGAGRPSSPPFRTHRAQFGQWAQDKTIDVTH